MPQGGTAWVANSERCQRYRLKTVKTPPLFIEEVPEGRRSLIINFKHYNRIMKKNYISPLAAEVNVEAEQMLAGSMRTSEQTIDTRNGGQLGGESRGEWGNLWN